MCAFTWKPQLISLQPRLLPLSLWKKLIGVELKHTHFGLSCMNPQQQRPDFPSWFLTCETCLYCCHGNSLFPPILCTFILAVWWLIAASFQSVCHFYQPRAPLGNAPLSHLFFHIVKSSLRWEAGGCQALIPLFRTIYFPPQGSTGQISPL